MKIIYGLISLILTTSVYADDSNDYSHIWEGWDVIGLTEQDSILHFSPEEIITEGKYKKAWVREIFFKSKSKFSNMTLMQINCSAKTMRVITRTIYSGTGQLISHQDLTSQKAIAPPPKTVGATIVKTICTGKSSFYDSIKQS